jgi:branched-chain amino acid aminotransferase
MKPTKYIWKNGKLIPWAEATTHVLTHALHYGTGVFEGIRAYKTPTGSAIFKATEHNQRLLDSAKIYKMDTDITVDELTEATKTLLHENSLKGCYIRPLIYYSYGEMGLNPGKNPIDVIIAAWEWGTYLGEEGLKSGIRCKMSSWARLDSRILPPLAKCTANYANSVLAKMEALQCGYDEAILLNINGTIAEGPGENIFMIKEGKLYTTAPSDGALQGITCKTIIQIAEDMGIEVITKSMIRDELFLADELFFTGTAAEVTPIREIDERIIGSGARGPMTEKLQTAYFKIVKGEDPKYNHWLTHVQAKEAVNQ